MKLFLQKTLLFILPLAILVSAGELLLRHAPNDYKKKKVLLEKNAKHIKILILGNSHAYYGINPAYLREDAFNMAYISQPLSYDLELLKKFSGECDSLRCVIVPVSYSSLYGRLESEQEKWRVKNYTIYYGIHNSTNLADYSEVFSNSALINFKKLQSWYVNHQDGITTSESGWGNNYRSGSGKNLYLSGIKAAERHTKKDTSNVAGNIAVLQEMAEISKSKNIRLVLVTLPAYSTYTYRINKAQWARTVSVAKAIDQSSESCMYINLLTDRDFAAGDFYDADHLNEKGAKKLSLKLDSLLYPY